MIRPATPEDAAAIAAVERLAFADSTSSTGAWSSELVDLELTAPGRVVVVAVPDDVLVGYASAAVIADVADLTRIAVVPEARRAGMARDLLAYLLDEVKRRGAARMMLEVADSNAPALGLYADLGFTEIARRRHYYGRDRDAVVMERTIGG